MPIKVPKGTLSIWPGSSGTIAGVPGGNAYEPWSPRARYEERILRRRSPYICQIDVSALLAIFFVLLITVMTPTFFFHQSTWVGVDLPKSEHSSWLPGARREDAMRVAVARDGKVFFCNRQTTFDQLPQMIQEALRAGAENRVYIMADARARYLDVKIALDAIRLAGVEHVSFITESRHQ